MLHSEDHGPEVHVKRIGAKEVIVVKEGDTFIVPCANGVIKLAGTGSEVVTADQFRQGPDKMEEHSSDHPGEEDDNSHLAEEPQQDVMEAEDDFWSFSGRSIHRHHVLERQYKICASRKVYRVAPEGLEFEVVINNARRKLELHMEPAMPCKSQTCSGNTTLLTSKVSPQEQHYDEHRREATPCEDTIYSRNCEHKIEAHESQRCRIQGSGKGDMMTALLTKVQFYESLQSCPQTHSYTSSDAEAAVDKKCDKLKNLPAWREFKVKSKKGVTETKRRKDGSVCYAYGLVSS